MLSFSGYFYSQAFAYYYSDISLFFPIFLSFILPFPDIIPALYHKKIEYDLSFDEYAFKTTFRYSSCWGYDCNFRNTLAYHLIGIIGIWFHFITTKESFCSLLFLLFEAKLNEFILPLNKGFYFFYSVLFYYR